MGRRGQQCICCAPLWWSNRQQREILQVQVPTGAPGGPFYLLGSVASLSLGGHCTGPSPGKTPGNERMHPGWRCARVLRPPEADQSAPWATARRRRTAAAHVFPKDAAPGATGPETPCCLLGWFQLHSSILFGNKRLDGDPRASRGSSRATPMEG